MSRSAVVLMSGGIDSTACIHMLTSKGWSVAGLFIKFGQSALRQETIASAAVARHYKIKRLQIEVDLGSGFGIGEIRGRNALFVFAALASSNLRTGTVAIGIHTGTPYYDCSPRFFRRARTLIQECSDGRIGLVAPFLNWNKSDIYQYCYQQAVPLHLTYSCEKGGRKPCGNCLSCKDRKHLKA